MKWRLQGRSPAPARTHGYRRQPAAFRCQPSASLPHLHNTISFRSGLSEEQSHTAYMTTDAPNSSVIQTIQDAASAVVVRAGRISDAIDGIEPSVVASLQSMDELSRLLSFANEAGLAVAPRGGGTQLGLGNRLGRLDVVADMSGLNRVVQHNAADLTLVVEAGITLAALRETLAAEGQFLALDAPLPERATIGGTLAVGVSGPLKWQYGSARDLVIGMKVAQADGRITQSGGNVVKNVSGYDMARLHVGGLGTLGVITEASFKLTPMPRRETTLLARFSSAAECIGAALGIFNSGVMPIALTAFSKGVIERICPSSVEASEYALAVRLGGRPRTLRRMEDEAFLSIRERTAQVDRLEQDARTLWAQLADFGYSTGEESVMSARVALLPNRVGRMMMSLDESEGAAVVAQPGYGMMSAHWFGEDTASSSAIRGAREAAHELGGSLIVERAPMAVKDGLDVWDYTGESLEVMRNLKAQYDPNGILNPNRFTGGI